MSDAGRQRDTLRRLFEAAVAAAHPSACVVPHLPAPPARGRLIVLAAGKAGASMAAAAERFYRDEARPFRRAADRARRDAPRLWRAGAG